MKQVCQNRCCHTARSVLQTRGLKRRFGCAGSNWLWHSKLAQAIETNGVSDANEAVGETHAAPVTRGANVPLGAPILKNNRIFPEAALAHR